MHAFRPARLATLFAIAASLAAGSLHAAPISGALFTTDTAGTVNVNQYENKADVYLNGGPGPNAPCTAAGMDDGTYVFKVTNPSGTVDLSAAADADITKRQFTVSGGVVVSAVNHPTVPGDCGGVRVQVAPFADTPNNGGVYKLWVTRLSDYTANGGFQPGSTKTDNFHVKVPSITPDTADLNVYKFYDANANGAWDPDEVPLFGWAMNARNGNGFDATQLTQSPDGLTTFAGLTVADNPYDVTEGTAGGTWHQSASIVNGVSTATPTNPVTGLNLVEGENTEVVFGNYCTCHSGGKPKSWWMGSYGKAKLADGSGMNHEFGLLNALALRRPDGSAFDLNLANSNATNWSLLYNWLNSTSTSNMAYALSRNLAILRLNIEAGYVSPLNFYAPFGGTVGELLTDANDALVADGLTPTGDPNRALQSQLSNWLIAINGGANVVRAKPCAFSFVN